MADKQIPHTNNVQVIDDDLNYNKQLDRFLKDHKLFERKSDYKSVAVIGCQSSGKSTLLNLLFETKFETMDQDEGRQQTTKGIWMSRSKDSTTLIYDIEGTDSKERGEQRMTFEQTTSLFALAIADVLMINMWMNDIGRYGASNYGLLKVIFECNLKLFGQQSSKNLIFVLRDFDDRGNNTEKYKGILMKDITKIWSEIHKPDEFKDTLIEDFFKFQWVMIPHKNFEEERFYEKCKELKVKFDQSNEDSFYGKDSKGSNVPMDGLSIYIDQTWECIRSQKELNLPDQREMVAQYRCSEIKEEAIQQIQEQIQQFQTTSKNGPVDQFQDQCQQIIKGAVTYFDQNASQYQTNVFEKVRKEVVDQIMQTLYVCFDDQLKMLRLSIFNNAEEQIRKFTKKGQINEDLVKHCQELFTQTISLFVKKSSDLIIDGSGWGNNVQSHQNEIQSQLQIVISRYKEKEIEKLQDITSQATHEAIEQILSGPIHELHDDFWDQIQLNYTNEIQSVLLNCDQILKKGFIEKESEKEDFMDRLESDIKLFAQDQIKKLFRDINTNLLRKFNKQFKNNEQGQPNNWVSIELEAIQDSWSKIKLTCIDLMAKFKYIEIPFDLAAVLNQTKGETETAEASEDGFVMQTKTAPRSFSQMPKTVMFGKLLSEVEINKVKDKFDEDTNNGLEEAIRKHHNVSQGNTPMWLYVVLVYFAYDDIFRMLANPILFYPLMFVMSMVAMMYSMGLGPIMIPVARTTINTGFRTAGVPYQV